MQNDLEALRIRQLVADTDARAVHALYERAADFVVLETGSEPSDTTVAQFFADCLPGADVATSRKLGMFMPSGDIVAIADLAFGYPETDDAYIGLLLIDGSCRGLGLGRVFLEHLTGLARAGNASRLLIALLDENPRGRAFWEREGFRLLASFPDFKLGRKTHVVHRMGLQLLAGRHG